MEERKLLVRDEGKGLDELESDRWSQVRGD